MNIIFLGSPNAGKGTQAKMVSKYLKIPSISIGNILRQLYAEENPIGIDIKEKYWGKGNLVPDDIIIKIMEDRLSKEDCKKGFILDGFPRTINQAIILESIVKIDYVIYIKTPYNIIIGWAKERMICIKCGKIYGVILRPEKEGNCNYCDGELYKRDDDKEEIIKKRIKIYEKETIPLVDFYKERKILETVDGNQSPDEVFNEILDIIV